MEAATAVEPCLALFPINRLTSTLPWYTWSCGQSKLRTQIAEDRSCYFWMPVRCLLLQSFMQVLCVWPQEP
jgi:hypothetical protein